jgi:hypothetical protein
MNTGANPSFLAWFTFPPFSRRILRAAVCPMCEAMHMGVQPSFLAWFTPPCVHTARQRTRVC